LNQGGSKICNGVAQAGVFEMGQYDSKLDRLKSSSFDPQALWDRLGGDMELLRELVEIFLGECPGLLRDIAAAIREGSFDDVRKFSHKLKGSALQFSGKGVAAVAASLEKMGQAKSLRGADQVFSDLEHEVAVLSQSLQSIAGEKGQSAD
jgi:two-component system, sensor histidine kinase and response regulator